MERLSQDSSCTGRGDRSFSVVFQIRPVGVIRESSITMAQAETDPGFVAIAVHPSMSKMLTNAGLGDDGLRRRVGCLLALDICLVETSEMVHHQHPRLPLVRQPTASRRALVHIAKPNTRPRADRRGLADLVFHSPSSFHATNVGRTHLGLVEARPGSWRRPRARRPITQCEAGKMRDIASRQS